MATSDKLTYLANTKGYIKDITNYSLPSTNQITSSTTFRAYKDKIFEGIVNTMLDKDSVFNALPKITTTPSTSQSINNTLHAPMKIKLKPSELSQAGTPTPESPQDIHSISGNNKISVCGKNLFDKDIFIQGTWSSSSNNLRVVGFIKKVKSGETYTVSIYNSNFKFAIGNSTKNTQTDNTAVQSDSGWQTTTYTYTITGDGYLWLQVAKTSGNISPSDLSISDFQIELGNQATTYTEHEENNRTIQLGDIEYCKIGNYEDEFIRNSGKNLCNGTNQLAYLNTAVNTCATGSGNSGLYIKVNGGNYTISTLTSQERYRVACVSNEPSATAQTAYNGVKKDGTSDSITIDTTGYSYLVVNATDLSKIQIEKGTTATSYEPYGTGQWYIKKNIGKVVLDGSESWFKSSVQTINRFGITFTDLGLIPINEQALSSHFVYKSGSSTVSGTFYLATTLSNMYIDYSAYDSMTKDDFKTWLSNNNVSMYLVLATPTYTQITGDLATQLEEYYESYDGQTNITQIPNDLPFVLDVSVLEDLR